MRTYYESVEYENEAELGTFAGITICGDDDGPHFIFGSGDAVIFDLAIPACEALALSYALSRAGKQAIKAAEREEAPPLAVEAPAERMALPRAADRFMERAPAYSPPAAWVERLTGIPAA